MSEAIELTDEEKSRLKDIIATHGDDCLKRIIDSYEASFELHFHWATKIAKKLRFLRELCTHSKRHEVDKFSWKCVDCGHMEVDTSFSKETNTWFKQLNDAARKLNPARVHLANGDVVEKEI